MAFQELFSAMGLRNGMETYDAVRVLSEEQPVPAEGCKWHTAQLMHWPSAAEKTQRSLCELLPRWEDGSRWERQMASLFIFCTGPSSPYTQ